MADIISLQERCNAVKQRRRAKLEERIAYLANEIEAAASEITERAWRVQIDIDTGFALITIR